MSCSKSDSNNFLIIEAEITEEKYNLSDVAEKVTMVPLETNDACLMSFISRVIVTKDYYFVLSSDLFQFDKKGNFIRQIGEQGRGPNEYIRINSIAVNEEEQTVFMATGEKLITYNFEGEIKKSTTFNKFVKFMTFAGEELFVISAEMGIGQANNKFKNEAKLYKVGSNLSIKDSLVVKSIELKKQTGSFNPGAQYISDLGEDQYLYYPTLIKESIIRDTLYRINNSKLGPFLKLNFKRKKNKHLLFKNVFRSKSFLFSEYNYNRKQYFFCYDFNTQKQMNMKNGFDDDILKTGSAKLLPLDIKSGLMYFVKDAYQVSEIIEGVEENDNPVFMVVKLKE